MATPIPPGDSGTSVTTAMMRVVKKCRVLSVPMKYLWLDFVPYKGLGCWQTAAQQGDTIGMPAETVEQYRRVLLRMGLLRQGERVRNTGPGGEPRRGRPWPTWYASFPSTVILPRRLIGDNLDRAVARLDEVLAAANRTPIRPYGDSDKVAAAQMDYPQRGAGNCATLTGGVSSGEGGRGERLTFSSQAQRACYSNGSQECQTPKGVEGMSSRARKALRSRVESDANSCDRTLEVEDRRNASVCAEPPPQPPRGNGGLVRSVPKLDSLAEQERRRQGFLELAASARRERGP